MARPNSDAAVGMRIVAEIKAQGKSQASVAAAIGMTPPALSSSIKTGSITSMNLLKLSRELGRSMSYFLTGENGLEVTVPEELHDQLQVMLGLYYSRSLSLEQIDGVLQQVIHADPNLMVGVGQLDPEIAPLVNQLRSMSQRRTLPRGGANALATLLRSFDVHQVPADIEERKAGFNAAIEEAKEKPSKAPNWRGRS